MPVDLNDKVTMWGGFTPAEVGVGGGILAIAFIVFIIGVSVILKQFRLGVVTFLLFSGPWIVFMIHRKNLPEGYLTRKWKQEGKFLVISVPHFKDPDLYSPLADMRGLSFDKEWEDIDV